jgi:Na+/melibiose symporter-like transporter
MSERERRDDEREKQEDERDPEGMPSGRQETEEERLDRNLSELLQELRVALPGVQVLFAFLLAVPFQQNFSSISEFDKKVYFATLLLTALASALLIAPSAYHRLTFRYQQKGRLVFVANRLAIAGLAALALAMTCAVMLITNVLFGTVATTIVTTVLVLTMFLVLWAVLPLKRRLRYRAEGLPLLGPPRER